MRVSAMQSRLMLIALVAVAPLAAVYGVVLAALLWTQQANTQASTLGVARAVATAVDNELRMTVAALEALAMTEALDSLAPEGLARAANLASDLRDARPEWLSVLLVSTEGRVLLNSELGTATGALPIVDGPSLWEVLRTGRPVVGAMAPGPTGRLAFAVRVPVLREGKPRAVLTAVVQPDAIAAVLQRQRVPEGWSVSVFDSRQARVARHADDQRLRGSAPSAALQRLLEQIKDRPEIVGEAPNADGVPSLAAVARMETDGWFAVVGASVEKAAFPFRTSFIAYGGGLLGSLALGSLAAWWVSRGVTRPIARLQQKAQAFGRGESITLEPAAIPEIDALERAFAAAAELRQHSEAEKQRLLRAEQDAKEASQAMQQRLSQLVSAGAALSQSLEEETTLAAIAQAIVPDLADICRIDLLNDHGVLERKLTHHVNPDRRALIAAMVQTRHASEDVVGSFPWVVATGRTFLHNIDEEAMPDALDPQLREFVATLDITAGCTVPLVARGRTIGAMAVLQAESKRRFTPEDGALIIDLAQRVALALDNVRLFAQARVAQRQAEDANQAKDEFLAMLGHELRNPLAPITLALQLMQRREPDAVPRERQIIDRQVRHLSRMVDDLLDVSRIVSGKIVLRQEPLDLRDVVARALELVLPALQQRAQMPRVSLPATPVPVNGDAVRLAQIIGNLLNNAAKFTDPTKLIRVELSIEYRVAQPEAVLQVIDEGIGIGPDLLPYVFERFTQGQQPLHRAAGGLGLGLAIALSLARLHGGTLAARSDGVELGSTFELRLPVQADLTPTRIQKSEASALAACAPLSLLVVDDNRDAADALSSWLEIEGHRVRTVYSAEEALEALTVFSADALICDIGLPGMSGLDLAESLRAKPETASLTMVALTGYGRDADRAKAMLAGFDAHFAKPAQPELLVDCLRRLLSTQQAVDPASNSAGCGSTSR